MDHNAKTNKMKNSNIIFRTTCNVAGVLRFIEMGVPIEYKTEQIENYPEGVIWAESLQGLKEELKIRANYTGKITEQHWIG